MANTLEYLFTCGRVIRDQTSGLFTYVDGFDTLFIPKESDFLYQNICIIARVYYAVGGIVKAEIRFVDPDRVDSTPVVITGAMSPGYIQLAAAFPIQKFTKVGKYYMKIKFQDVELENENKFYFEVLKRQ